MSLRELAQKAVDERVAELKSLDPETRERLDEQVRLPRRRRQDAPAIGCRPTFYAQSAANVGD